LIRVLKQAADNPKPLVHGGMDVLADHRAAGPDGQMNEAREATSVDVSTQNDCTFPCHPILIEITPARHQAPKCKSSNG